MGISIEIWNTMINMGSQLLPILIITILVLLEGYFIRIKNKGKIILPAAALIFAFIFLFVQFKFVNFDPPNSLKTQIEYTSRSGLKSRLTILHTEKEHILAIGQLITEEGANSRFIDLTVKNDKIISASEPVDVIENIESDLSSFSGSYAGNSVPYGTLLEMEEAYKDQQPYQIDFISFLYRCVYSFIAVIILLLMCGINHQKERGGVNKI